MMPQTINDHGHEDMIHDAVPDYYGRRLATCSSDKTIKIFEIDDATHRLTDTLRGHESAVWCVSWAHPKFGTILASASYDSRVFIWRQSPPASNATQSSTWQRVYDYTLHTASVNSISWSPSELGCLLACASTDGNVSVLEFTEGRWDHVMFPAHGAGVNSVSWAPMWGGGGQGAQGASKRRFVTGGSDCVLKIWEWDAQSSTYSTTHTLPGHSDWVRDVAWCPTILSTAYIASASQDKTVRIWTSDSGSDYKDWKESTVLEFDSACWRCSWSLAGNVLAVGGADNKISLWKEDVKGRWEKVKSIDE